MRLEKIIKVESKSHDNNIMILTYSYSNGYAELEKRVKNAREQSAKIFVEGYNRIFKSH